MAKRKRVKKGLFQLSLLIACGLIAGGCKDKETEKRIAELERKLQKEENRRETEERRQLQETSCPTGYKYVGRSQDCQDKNGCTPEVPHFWADQKCHSIVESETFRIINLWLMDQKQGGFGFGFWHSEQKSLQERMFNVQSWQILQEDFLHSAEHFVATVRIRSSTRGGFPI